MWNTLPNLTRFRARGANAIGAFGLVMDPLPMLTNQPFWLHRRSMVPLPIITGRGVKYTHNDIKHTVLHPDSGPTGLCVIHQERHQSLEVDHDHTRSAEYTRSGAGGAPATTTPNGNDCPDTVCEAT